jgi:hypothetical protein
MRGQSYVLHSQNGLFKIHLCDYAVTFLTAYNPFAKIAIIYFQKLIFKNVFLDHKGFKSGLKAYEYSL